MDLLRIANVAHHGDCLASTLHQRRCCPAGNFFIEVQAGYLCAKVTKAFSNCGPNASAGFSGEHMLPGEIKQVLKAHGVVPWVTGKRPFRHMRAKRQLTVFKDYF